MPFRTLEKPGAFQFRLLSLIVFTTWAAFACVGIREPTAPWETLIRGFTLVSVMLTALIAIYRNGGQRAVALGYLIFCGGYIAYICLSRGSIQWPFGLMPTADDSESIPLVLYYALHGDPFMSAGGNWSGFQPNVPRFTNIIHHTIACILGIVGGVAAHVLYLTKRIETTARREDST
jgi:hypothetical protein